MLHRKIIIAVVTPLLLLAGCLKSATVISLPGSVANPPPAFANAETPVSPAIQAQAIGQDRWWTVFGNPDLDALVDKALIQNLDLRQATARVLEYEALLARAGADRFPSLGLQNNASWSEAHAEVSSLAFSRGALAYTTQNKTVHSTGLDIMAAATYELDLWGRIARSSEAARADLLAVEENSRTATLTVIAETVNLFLEMEAINRRIAITEQSIQDYGRNLDFVKMRYEGGIASVLDLRQARRLLAQAQSLLPPLRRDLEAASNALAVLTGQYPSLPPPASAAPVPFRDLPPLPPGLPSQLLLRRPDVREAEARLQAASARIGAARAARFPTISLTGGLGYASQDLGSLFFPESQLWKLASGILAPVFDGGRLKAGEEAARARYAQQEAAYAKVVLTAFAEVENALEAQREQAAQRRLLKNLVEESQATLETATQRYERGLTGYLSVLDAQQVLYTAQQNLILSELAIYKSRAALHRALAGGLPAPSISKHQDPRNEQP